MRPRQKVRHRWIVIRFSTLAASSPLIKVFPEIKIKPLLIFFSSRLSVSKDPPRRPITITQDPNLKSENANYHNSSRSGLRWKPILDALKAQRTTPMGARANKLGAKYCAAAVSCNLEANIGGGGSTDQRRKVTLIRKSLFWKPAAAADPIVSLKVFQVSCGAKVNPQPQGAAVSLVGRLSFNVIRIKKPNGWLEAEHVNCIFKSMTLIFS